MGQSVYHLPQFAFLINNQPINWINASTGIRQGDPLSSSLFIIASQNLTVIFNHAPFINFVHGFDSRIPRNFNHLMYTDDLILVIRAFRGVARNVNLRLSIQVLRDKNLTSPNMLFLPWLVQYESVQFH